VKRVDEVSFMQRFTPRKPQSIWSLINIERATNLIQEGRMCAPGLKAFQARDPKRSGVYSFENRPRKLSPEYAKTFRESADAWKWFQARPAGFKRLAIWRVMNAKRPATQAARLKDLIRNCAMAAKVSKQGEAATSRAAKQVKAWLNGL